MLRVTLRSGRVIYSPSSNISRQDEFENLLANIDQDQLRHGVMSSGELLYVPFHAIDSIEVVEDDRP